jgi:hypothetical protein
MQRDVVCLQPIGDFETASCQLGFTRCTNGVRKSNDNSTGAIAVTTRLEVLCFLDLVERLAHWAEVHSGELASAFY